MATTTKKTTSKSPANPPKPSGMTVEFVQDDADQTLLAAIETELATGEYSNFSDLCKDALQQFLLEPEFDEVSEADAGAEIDPALLQFHQQLADIATTVNQSLAEMRQQLNQVEQTLVTRETTQVDQFSEQLVRLEQQIERLTPTMAMSNASLAEELALITEDSASAAEADRSSIADPLLLRLRALLEEF